MCKRDWINSISNLNYRLKLVLLFLLQAKKALQNFQGFRTEFRGKTSVKGKGEMDTFWLLGCDPGVDERGANIKRYMKTFNQSPFKTSSLKHILESPSLKHIRVSPTLKQIRESPTLDHIRGSPSSKHYRESSSLKQIRESTTLEHIREFPNLKHIRESPNRKHSVLPALISPSAYKRLCTIETPDNNNALPLPNWMSETTSSSYDRVCPDSIDYYEGESCEANEDNGNDEDYENCEDNLMTSHHHLTDS